MFGLVREHCLGKKKIQMSSNNLTTFRKTGNGGSVGVRTMADEPALGRKSIFL